MRTRTTILGTPWRRAALAAFAAAGLLLLVATSPANATVPVSLPVAPAVAPAAPASVQANGSTVTAVSDDPTGSDLAAAPVADGGGTAAAQTYTATYGTVSLSSVTPNTSKLPAGAPVSSAATSTAAAVHCTEWVAWYTAYNAIHKWLWKFNLDTYYCYNGSKVTYHYTQAYPTMSSLGAVLWEYDGLLSPGIVFHCYNWNSNSCSGNYESAQGHFRICLINNWGCIDNVYPRIQEWETANGSFYYNVS